LLSGLPFAVFGHLGGMVTELVLATDMTENGKFLEMFQATLNNGVKDER
jgi:hypothetical protein